jgi:hypothetical protein
LDTLIEIIAPGNRTIGFATSKVRALQLVEAHKKQVCSRTEERGVGEAEVLLSAMLQQTARDEDHATFTDSLYRLREIYRDSQFNSDKETKKEAKT